MVEMFTSLLSNYKSKIRNPFFGTLISVWLIRNWSIVYALFNFDKECKLDDNLKYIKNYFEGKSYWGEIWTNIWVSFVVLGFTFVLLALSRALTDLYYKIIESRIIVLMDKNAIFTMEDKKTLESKNYLLEKKLKTKEEDLLRHLGDNQNLKTQRENDVKRWNSKVDLSDKELKTLNETVDNLNSKISKFNELEKWLWTTALSILKESDINILLKPTYKYTITYVGDGISKDVLYLSKLGLINMDKIGSQNKVLRTKLGDIFIDYYNTHSEDIINEFNLKKDDDIYTNINSHIA